MVRAVALAPVDTAFDVLDWVEAHPTLMGLLSPFLLYALTAAVTAWKKPKTPEEYSALSQKTAAFWKVFGSLFCDVPKLRQALNEFKHGYVPRDERTTLPDGLKAVRSEEDEP